MIFNETILKKDIKDLMQNSKYNAELDYSTLEVRGHSSSVIGKQLYYRSLAMFNEAGCKTKSNYERVYDSWEDAFKNALVKTSRSKFVTKVGFEVLQGGDYTLIETILIETVSKTKQRFLKDYAIVAQQIERHLPVGTIIDFIGSIPAEVNGKRTKVRTSAKFMIQSSIDEKFQVSIKVINAPDYPGIVGNTYMYKVADENGVFSMYIDKEKIMVEEHLQEIEGDFKSLDF